MISVIGTDKGSMKGKWYRLDVRELPHNITPEECYIEVSQCYIEVFQCYIEIGQCYIEVSQCYIDVSQCNLKVGQFYIKVSQPLTYNLCEPKRSA